MLMLTPRAGWKVSLADVLMFTADSECPVNEVFIMHFIMFQEKKLFRKGVANVFGEGYLR